MLVNRQMAQKEVDILLNIHTCSLIFLSPILNVRLENSTPMVCDEFSLTVRERENQKGSRESFAVGQMIMIGEQVISIIVSAAAADEGRKFATHKPHVYIDVASTIFQYRLHLNGFLISHELPNIKEVTAIPMTINLNK